MLTQRHIAGYRRYLAGWTGACLAVLLTAAPWPAVWLLGVGLLPHLEEGFHRYDFSLYYVWSYAMRHGINPYATDLGPLGASLGLDVGVIRHANYPASFVLLFEPLTLLTPYKAYWTWTLINAGLLFCALALLLPGKNNLGRTWNYALLALALLYRPVGADFFFGQSAVLILFLLAAAMRLTQRRREVAAGVALGLAGLVKIFPLMAVAAFVVGRRWRVVGSALGTVFLGLCLTVAMVGVAPTFGLLHTVNFLLDRQWLTEAENVSLNAFASRVLWSRPGIVPQAFAGLAAQRALVAVVSLGIIALTARATRALQAPGDLSASLALWAAAAVLVSPTAWHYDMLLLLLPFSAAVRSALRHRELSGACLVAAASYALTQVAWLWLALAPLHLGGWLALVLNEGFFLSLLLGYAAAFLLVRSARPAALSATPAIAEPRLLLQETVAP